MIRQDGESAIWKFMRYLRTTTIVIAASVLWVPASKIAGPNASPAGIGLGARVNAQVEAFAQGSERMPQILMIVGLSWEGESLSKMDLDAVRTLRQQYGGIPLVHFISPAYFTKGDGLSGHAKAKIKSVLRSGDSVGLNLGGWQSVVTQAGAIFREGPTFWGYELAEKSCLRDCGREVPLYVYSEDELRKILRFSVKTLQDNGLGTAAILHVQGWTASPAVLAAAAAEGFKYDFSAIPPVQVARRLAPYPLYQWIKGLWSDLPDFSEPYVLSTPTGSLTEMTMSGSIVDYSTRLEAEGRFRQAVRKLKGQKDQDVVFYLGAHLESAATHVPRIVEILGSLQRIAAEERIVIRPYSLPGTTLDQALIESVSADAYLDDAEVAH